jgi:hypothetical protein
MERKISSGVLFLALFASSDGFTAIIGVVGWGGGERLVYTQLATKFLNQEPTNHFRNLFRYINTKHIFLFALEKYINCMYKTTSIICNNIREMLQGMFDVCNLNNVFERHFKGTV